MKLRINLLSFEAVAATRTHKLEDFTFFEYTGNKKTIGGNGDFNQRHALVIKKGDVIGLKKTARGAGAGNYQIVNANLSLSALFRNVPKQIVAGLTRNFKEYDGVVKEMEDGAGGRARKTSTKKHLHDDRDTSELFRGEDKKEISTYDKKNYQWRKVTSSAHVPLKTAKQGRVREHLKHGDIFGVRFIRPRS